MHARFADASSLLEQPEINKAAADAIAPAITKRRFAICFTFRKVITSLAKSVLARHEVVNQGERIGSPPRGHYPFGYDLVNA
jgi:hypothetical protein